MSGDRLVRVRGGPKGVRHITLDEWKRELREKKGKLLPAKTPRQQRQEVEAKGRRERADRRKKKAKKKGNRRP